MRGRVIPAEASLNRADGQIFLFPPITNWLGCRTCLRITAFTLPVAYGALPFTLLLPASVQLQAVYILIVLKTVATTFAFPCSTIMMTNSSPSLRLLGSKCRSFRCVCRGVGISCAKVFGAVEISLMRDSRIWRYR